MEFLQKYHSEIVNFIKRYVSTNNKISEDVKQKTLNDIEPALNDIPIYLGEELQVLEKYYPTIENIFYEYIKRLYFQAYTRGDCTFHKNVCRFLLFYSIKILITEEKFWDKAAHNSAKFIEKHPYVYNAVSMFLDQFYLEDPIINANNAEVDKSFRMLQPVNIKSVNGTMNLYHGTSMESYKKIIEDGYIIATDYSGLESKTDIQFKEEYNKRYNTMQTGYCFFSQDLSYTLDYAINRNGVNAIGFSAAGNENIPSKEEIIDSRINSSGVIFVIDPKKYLENLYYVPANNEFLIKGNVDIRDAKVMFVHRTKGKISLTDGKGDKVNDLCYE